MKFYKHQTKHHCYIDSSIQALALALFQDMKKALGFGFTVHTCASFSHGTISWYSPIKDFEDFKNNAMKVFLKNTALTKKWKKKLFTGAKPFLQFLSKIEKIDLSKLTNKELWNLYESYVLNYRRLFVWGEPPCMALRQKLGDLLLDYLKINSSNASEDLNILTAPHYISFTQREQYDLATLALKKDKEKLVKQHTKKYCWIPYDYGVMIWDEKHFRNELKKLKNPKKIIKEINAYLPKLKKQQKDLTKKLKIDKKHQIIFEALRDLTVLMDYKKEVFTKAHYFFRVVIEEVARRLQLSVPQMKALLNEEVKLVLSNKKKVSKKILNERLAFSVCNINKKGEYVYTTGKKAKEFYSRHLKEKIVKETVIQGHPASRGKRKGKVRVIVDAKNINTLKKGEILVTHMTSPDYIMGVKKAGAIVTDEGGITCHAAIISRELNIPCITGTKTATETLKTGDKVEVDANKGTVRKIK